MKKIAVKQLRRNLNLTLKEMAAQLGVNKSTVWRWEKYGVPSRGAAAYLLMAMWENFQDLPPSPEFVDGCAVSRAGYEQNDAQQY
ncbi:helix-turn-helix domain-containing protein [Bartonella schoenbuchensis]|uniref:helix-turn-helix domain-containing protein n=1 Tax=Bartonella schoenbuchensis TaxID=165694 RepID=UPI0031454FE6